MNDIINSNKKTKSLTSPRHQKPFLSIDSDFSVLELYKILIKNPYLVNTEDEKNETFLSYAIKRNNNPIINLILTSPILNLTYQNENGNTYLHLAVIQQNLKLVQVLLDKGTFIDIQNNDGNTALHLAYYVNNLKIIKLLIENNIDFGIKNKIGLTAEEIDPTDNINEIAGYEVNYDFDDDVNDEDINNFLNLNEELNLKKQIIDSSNSGETKYISQFSKDKKNSLNKKNEIGIPLFNENRHKKKKKYLKSEEISKNNNEILNEINDIMDNDKIKTKKKEEINDINFNDFDTEIYKNNESKTLNNNIPIYEEHPEENQDFTISHINMSKKNNISNFLENNEFNCTNNDNDESQVKGFFLNNSKGDGQSFISNIPKMDDDINKKDSNNKKEERVEKVITCKNKPLFEFLLQINMQKYYNNLNNNGFEYINMIIDDYKMGNYLTDKQLKMIGINIPGDRAKILIRFEEKANFFEFTIPKSVYYINNNLDQIGDDLNVFKLNGWLKNIRLEQYIRNFVLNGYFSLDLLLVQSISKNPITDEILKDDFGIDKLGHRARILNKLKEESKNFENKLRDSIVTFHTAENSKICSECYIF